MKKYLLIFCISFYLCSCNEIVYEVYKTKSDGIELDNGKYKFDKSEMISITYDFWDDGGSMWFLVYNKTEKPIFINLDRSHLIVNGRSVDYYNENIISQSDFYSIGYYDRFYKNTNGASSTTTFKNKKVIEIPPKSSVVIHNLLIYPKAFTDCGLEEKQLGISSKSYNESTSPIVFRNYITFDYNDKFETPKTIENAFWVSDVLIMYENSFEGKTSSQKDCNGHMHYLVKEMPYKDAKNFYHRIENK